MKIGSPPHLVAVSCLVPVHVAGFRIADTLCPPVLLVVAEHKVLGAGTLAAPLVAAPVLRPVVLVVARVAAAVAAVALPGEGLKDDELAGGAGTPVAHPMALARRGVLLRGGEVEVCLGAGVLETHPRATGTAHEELGRLAGPRRVLPIAGVGGRPIDVLLLALAAWPARLGVVAEELPLLAGPLGVQLEALVQGGEVVGGVAGAGALTAPQGVIVGEQEARLTGTLPEKGNMSQEEDQQIKL